MKKNLFLRVGMCALAFYGTLNAFDDSQIGSEIAIPKHLQDGDEYRLPIRDLIDFGRKLFTARWTSQEGAGRPLRKGTGDPLTDPLEPLVFPRNFNRISGPDTNSCAGCRDVPGAVASRIVSRSAVIWRASISMKPEPNMPTVLRELPMLCSETGMPRSSNELFAGSVSFRLNVAKSKRWASTKTFPTISPPPPISGTL